jgi:hypothetical protein
MLKDVLDLLERAEFFNKKCYQENLRREVGSKYAYYDISIFNTRLTTIQCSLEAFKGLYGIIPRSEGYELAVNNRRSYLITILSNLTTKEKVKWIFRKTSKFVNIITSSRGIVDSETEVYIFGYLVSQQLLDFIYIDDLLLEVEKKKEISGKLSKGDVSYVMSTSGIYYDKTDKDIIRIGPPPVNGMVYSRAGKKKFIMMIPKSRKVTKSELLSTWSHELHHMARDSFGVMNREYFLFEDILVEYMEKSLPILKELIWKRKNM